MELLTLAKRLAGGILQRRKLLFVGILIVSLVPLLAGGYYLFASQSAPRYTATATVLLTIRPDRLRLFQEFSPRLPVPVQISILRSRALAEAVLDALPKATAAEMFSAPPATTYRQQVTELTRSLMGAPPVVSTPRARAVREIQARMGFKAKTRQGLVEITALASRPERATDLLLTYIDVLTDRTRSFNVEEARATREFLEQQLVDAQQALKERQDALAEHRRARGGITIADDHQRTLARLSALEGTLSEVQTNKQVVETRLAALREKLAVRPPQIASAAQATAPSTGAAGPTVTVPTLQTRLVQLETRLIEQQGRYTEEHPRIVQIRTEIDDTRVRLHDLLAQTVNVTPAADAIAPDDRESFARQVLQLEEELVSLRAQEEALNRQLPEVRRALDAMPAGLVEYARLVRDLDSKRKLHDTLTDNLARSRTREQGEMQAVTVIDPPDEPVGAVLARSSLFLFLAIGGALAFALGVSGIVEYRRMPVETEDDVEVLLGLPVLGIIPALPRARGVPLPPFSALRPLSSGNGTKSATPAVAPAEDEPLLLLSDAFRRLRASLQIAAGSRPMRTLLVTSPHETEGKTTIVLNIAYVCREAGTRVLLADADFYRPKLQPMLRVSGNVGLVDALRGEAPVQEAIVPVTDGLAVSGRGRGSAVEGRGLLGTPRARDVIEDMAREADLVLFDSSPVLVVPDNLLLAARVDGVVLVARAGQTELRDLLRTKQLLERAGANVLGVVLNGYRFRAIQRQYRRYYKSYLVPEHRT